MERVKNFLKKTIELIKKPEMRTLPGNLAFFFVMSLIPIVALIAYLASKFSISLKLIEGAIDISIPNGVKNFIETIISSQGINFNIGIFFVSAFLLASNGMHSVIIASNQIYKVKSANVIKRRSKSVIMTLLLVEVVVILILIPIFGDSIFNLLNSNYNNNLIKFFYRLYQLLKYPLVLVIIYFNIKLIYYIAPDKEINKNTTTKGALFTTISWLIASELYSFYLDSFNHYDVFYGSISNILILLLWVYMLAYIFVIGLIINAGCYSEADNNIGDIEKKDS